MISKSVLEKLCSVVGEDRITQNEVALLVYECDGQTFFRNMPDAVVFPVSAEEVAQIVKICIENNIPYLPRGSGTSLSGGAVPIKKGVIIELSLMNKVLEVDLENHRLVVQPGLLGVQATDVVTAKGFFYAPDPGSYTVATIGGNIGHDSGGNHTIKYGVTSNHVLGLELVTSSGEILELGGKALDVPGYDLVGLVVGSDGTLGVVTKAVLRILRKPPAVAALLAIFDSIVDASNTVSEVIGKGIVPAAIEFMDKDAVKAVESGVKACGLPLDAEAVLLFEVEGFDEELDIQGERIIEICKRNHVREVKMAKDEEERMKLMAGRKAAFGAMGNLAPGFVCVDGTIPRSKLPEVLSNIKKMSEEHSLVIPNVFHAGDGNLHPLILYDPRQPGEAEKALKLGLDILRLCLNMDGTITGEHGIGVEKLELMPVMFSEEDLKRMSIIKEVFDPKGLCNPGKVLPPVKVAVSVASSR